MENNLENNIASELADYLCFMIDAPKPELKAKTDEIIKKLKSQIEKNRNNEKEFERLNEKLGYLLVKLNGELNSPPHFIVNTNDLEPNSKVYLQTGNLLYQYYEQNKSSFSKLDYSPMILFIGKLFELEINLSIVQWIRENQFEIPMPDYFNEWCSDIATDALYKLSYKREIDFNENRYEKWIAPSSGDSEAVFRDLVQNKKKIIVKFSYADELKLLENWEKLRLLRNAAAHGNKSLDSKSLEKVSGICGELNGFSIFKKMTDLKLSCQNE